MSLSRSPSSPSLDPDVEMKLGLALIQQGQQMIAQGNQHVNNARSAMKSNSQSGYPSGTGLRRNQSFVNANSRTFGVSNFNETHISKALKNISPDSRWQKDIEDCHDLAKFAIKYLAKGSPLRETAKIQFVKALPDNKCQPFTRAQVCGETIFDPENNPLNTTRACEPKVNSFEEFEKTYPECHTVILSMDKADLAALAMALQKAETVLNGQNLILTMMHPSALTRIPFPRGYFQAVASNE